MLLGYCSLLVVLGALLIVLGVLEPRGAWITLWLGADLLALGIAHGLGTHRLFGKRSDGTLPLWSWLLFLPLLAGTLIVWHLLRLFSREAAGNDITDHLVVGRRLLPSELDGPYDNYVDLTAEFTEPVALRQSPSYVCFPILDGSAPTPEALRLAIDHLRPGRTFVHCAQGHGRSGLFALAMLLSSGIIRTVDEGLQLLTEARPGVQLTKDQQRCIQAFAQQTQPK